MEQENKKKGWLKRSFVRVLACPESPFAVISGIRKAMIPKKVAQEELAAFRKLTPEQRWSKVKKPDWTDEKLAQERKWSCWLSYVFLGCGLLIWAATGLAVEYLEAIQIAGALAYGGAAFLMFAKKSMWVYALDNRKVIFFDEWLRMPGEWLT